MNSSEHFREYGYVKISDFLSQEITSLTRKYMDLSLFSGHMVISDNSVIAGQPEQYAAMLSESLLLFFQPNIESVVGYALLPTYSFWRIYEHGAVLREHVDRDSCEISVSVTIAAEPRNTDWRLWVRGIDRKNKSLSLRPGDCVIYLGNKVPHWRNKFKGGVQYQMFLHYIRQDNNQNPLAYDGRNTCALALFKRSMEK
ncbi:hypothetical protein [Citrobacter youngae]|uniref:hypothetical protein n=1 Tax=Citrobacter youngae TaxID=133448 RepID=UPI0039B46104